MRSFFVGGGKTLPLPLPLPLETDCWWYFVGPQNPNRKKKTQIRSTRFRFPESLPTSITYAEIYAHWTLVGADLFWSCRLMTCIWYNATMMLFSPVAGEISPVSSWKLRERRGNDNKSKPSGESRHTSLEKKTFPKALSARLHD